MFAKKWEVHGDHQVVAAFRKEAQARAYWDEHYEDFNISSYGERIGKRYFARGNFWKSGVGITGADLAMDGLSIHEDSLNRRM